MQGWKVILMSPIMGWQKPEIEGNWEPLETGLSQKALCHNCPLVFMLPPWEGNLITIYIWHPVAWVVTSIQQRLKKLDYGSSHFGIPRNGCGYNVGNHATGKQILQIICFSAGVTQVISGGMVFGVSRTHSKMVQHIWDTSSNLRVPPPSPSFLDFGKIESLHFRRNPHRQLQIEIANIHHSPHILFDAPVLFSVAKGKV